MGDVDVDVHLGAEAEALGLSADAVAAAARVALAHHQVATAAISIALVGDEEIARLNAAYLGHEGPTDVISFPLTTPDRTPVGDIYIGVEQAMRQAGELGVPVAEEVLRLAIHGTLHVLGHEHPEFDREGSEMYRLQEVLLRRALGDAPGGS